MARIIRSNPVIHIGDTITILTSGGRVCRGVAIDIAILNGEDCLVVQVGRERFFAE